MPEGDSIAKAAARIRPVLVGQKVDSVYGTAPGVRTNARRLAGRRVEDVRTFGKHLVVDFDIGFSLRVHLGMPGRWSVIPADRPVPGSARVVLSTSDHHVCCFAAPDVEVDRTPAIERRLDRLGPDVLADGFEPARFVERARTRQAETIAEVLLDQRVVAGIGNVYKSELLFLAGIHPETSVEAVPDVALLDMAERASRLLAVNVRSGARSTTGERAPGRETWVYDRAGRPCRRCSSEIKMVRLAERVTYWCPSCQPKGQRIRR